LTLQTPSDDATTAAIAAPTPGSASRIAIAPGPSTMVPYIATNVAGSDERRASEGMKEQKPGEDY